MTLDNIKLAKSSLTDTVFIGTLSKDGKRWLQKKDVTNMFLSAAIARWEGQQEVIKSGDTMWEITVKKIPIQPK